MNLLKSARAARKSAAEAREILEDAEANVGVLESVWHTAKMALRTAEDDRSTALAKSHRTDLDLASYDQRFGTVRVVLERETASIHGWIYEQRNLIEAADSSPTERCKARIEIARLEADLRKAELVLEPERRTREIDRKECEAWARCAAELGDLIPALKKAVRVSFKDLEKLRKHCAKAQRAVDATTPGGSAVLAGATG